MRLRRWWCVLRRPVVWRRTRRTRRRLIVGWRRSRVIHFWTARFRPIVGLCRSRPIHSRRWLRRPIVRRRRIRLWPVVRLRLTWFRTSIRRRCVARNRTARRLVRWCARRLACRPRHNWLRRACRRSHLHRRTRCRDRGIRSLQTLHFLPRQRLAGMGCQSLLSGCEGHRRRWCGRLRDYRSARHRGGRCCHPIRRVGVHSQNAVRRRRNSSPGVHWHRSNLSGIDRHGCAGNGLTARECILRNGRNRTRNALVHVGDISDVCGLVDDGRVIDIRHGRGVHGRIADVDTIDVTATHRIRRHIHFPRT